MLAPPVTCRPFSAVELPGGGARVIVRAVSPQINEGRPFCAAVDLTRADVDRMKLAMKRWHEQQHAAMSVRGVAPPGMEHVVRSLKNRPGVSDPYAVAWAMYRRRGGVSGVGDSRLLTANFEFKTSPWKVGREVIDLGTGTWKMNPYKIGGTNMVGYTRMSPWKLGADPMDPFKMGGVQQEFEAFKVGESPMDPFKMGQATFAMGALRRAQIGAAAATVTAAKKGDPKARKRIAKTAKAAKRGHKGAQQAMKDMRAIDAAQKRRGFRARRAGGPQPLGPVLLHTPLFSQGLAVLRAQAVAKQGPARPKKRRMVSQEVSE